MAIGVRSSVAGCRGRGVPVTPSGLAPQLTPHGMCNVMRRDPTQIMMRSSIEALRWLGKGKRARQELGHNTSLEIFAFTKFTYNV